MSTATVTSLTTAALTRKVERYAELQRAKRDIDAELDELKALFIDAGQAEYAGRSNKITVSEVTGTRLDQTEVKARLTPRDYVECVRVTTSTRVLCRAL
jgi:hypothetical protein